ncbi:immunity 26/phosphotriesterase HocA family protein [Tepidibacter hydrothermalis]|uniref:Immunity 26/phosphotriesterase HocA family protein n=1 Tax=Tepidibacter hydrothermalis TaxID=3036126 RepID=A0ABY8EGM3_9FIRM|nr:immunity 26/phosphotriesterase HocA family protein [Tepidibacter hydrothermalis]WFD11926.1 immunity 26/phosphotriesterase HocA family protein [Tepidibacter hydrothermalis]
MGKINFRNLMLTNEQRKYFAIDLIGEDWDTVEIKAGYYVVYDGDIIRKVISYYNDDKRLEYYENDVEIHTRNRVMVLPKTARGKEKKINFTSISSRSPHGIQFGFSSVRSNRNKNDPGGTNTKEPANIFVRNTKNALSIPICNKTSVIRTVEEFKGWVEVFIRDVPVDYMEKVDKVKNTPHQTIKYYNGDIFRFEFDLEHYGFGLIIGQISKMKKEKVILKNHVLAECMMVPLLVRCYAIKTKDKAMHVKEITKHPLLPVDIMADNGIIWGTYDIVGSKVLTQEDIEFPLQIGPSISYGDKSGRICWGIGMKMIEEWPIDLGGDYLENRKYLENGVAIGINVDIVEAQMTIPTLASFNIIDLKNIEDKRKLFTIFDIPRNITFDEFNRKYNGMTKEEYVNYANKKRRP